MADEETAKRVLQKKRSTVNAFRKSAEKDGHVEVMKLMFSDIVLDYRDLEGFNDNYT